MGIAVQVKADYIDLETLEIRGEAAMDQSPHTKKLPQGEEGRRRRRGIEATAARGDRYPDPLRDAFSRGRGAVRGEEGRNIEHQIRQQNLNLPHPSDQPGCELGGSVAEYVAYEVCMESGPLVLARYTELMNGIIDTEVDAKFLCERGIIVNHLKSEKDVAELWNGMSKGVALRLDWAARFAKGWR